MKVINWAFCALMMVCASQPALASFTETRVLNRKSAFCAGLLLATRALGETHTSNETRAAFERFRRVTLASAPILDVSNAGPVNTNAQRFTSGNPILARRVYAVERSFSAPVNGSERVLSTARFELEENAEPLASHVGAVNAYFAWSAEQLFERRIRRDLRDLVPDIQYSWHGLAMLAAGTYWSGSAMGLTAVSMLADFNPVVIASSAFFSSISVAVGSFDYPVHYVRSFRDDLQHLTQALTNFETSGQEWMYWSRDFLVAPEFVRGLTSESAVNWAYTVRAEDYRELTSGLHRYLDHRDRKAAGQPLVRFQIDVLVERIDGIPHVAMVIRSQPKAERRVKVHQSAGIPALAGAEGR